MRKLYLIKLLVYTLMIILVLCLIYLMSNISYIKQIVKDVKLFKRATSLGGTESLIEHRATVEGTFGNSPKNLLRISVGLEDPQDLIEDLNQALNKV